MKFCYKHQCEKSKCKKCIEEWKKQNLWWKIQNQYQGHKVRIKE